MFTGIIETVGEVVDLHREAGNLFITMNSAIGNELTVDQSVAHNGVCLTVVKVLQIQHVVIAIEETLSKTNLGNLHIGDLVNLERCLQMGGRLDGHIVQGHVDGKAKLLAVLEQNGSYVLNFEIDAQFRNLIVEKGSICLNGISLTLINVTDITFAVAIIPYTWEHTNIQTLKIGDDANVEFDIIGKYVNRMQRFN